MLVVGLLSGVRTASLTLSRPYNTTSQEEDSNMYQTVGTMLSWMNNSKGSPASSVSAKAAVLALLGDLAQAHGGAMVALYHDTVTLIVKLVRAAPDLARSRHISQISLHLPHLPDLTVSPPDLRQVRAAPDSHYFLQRIAASS